MPSKQSLQLRNFEYHLLHHCALSNKLYIGESGRKLGGHFREHLLDMIDKELDLSKPVASHFNLPGHSH